MSHNTQNPLNDLPQRYHSSIGWDGPKPDKAKEAERIRRRDEGLLESLLEIRGASEWMRDAAPAKSRRELFPNFWREGDLAVLVGPPGVGRSILAVQIAETIARGTTFRGSPPYEGGVDAASADGVVLSSSPLVTRHAPLGIVYFDFERSPEQFAERYTARAANGRRVKYRFAPRHQRTHPGPAAAHLRGYGYGREQMLLGALKRKTTSMDANIMIVEDLSHLTGLDASANDIRATLRKFRRWCGGVNSALIIAELDPHDLFPTTPDSRLRMRHSKRLSAILAEADSVFALCPSTMSPDTRYLKSLKSSSIANSLQLPLASANGSQPKNKNSPPYEGGVDAASADGVVLSPAPTTPIHPTIILPSHLGEPVPAYRLTRSKELPSLTTANRQQPPAGSFVGFQYLGMTVESDHTRDYAAEALKAQRAEERSARQAKLNAKSAIVRGYLNGEYERYLNGE